MPTYDYRCNECGHAFEAFHSITASPLKKCPECGKRKLERLIGAGAAVIFRGSGFYCTDYKKGRAPEAAPAPSASEKTPPKDTSSGSNGSGDGGGKD
jgi:putative FmdB family regulatory protein